MARKSKKRKKKSAFSWILFIISIYFIISILLLNVLDIAHLSICIIAIVVINLVLLLIMKKFKKLGFLLRVGFGILLLFLSFNVNKTASFLNSLELNYKTYHYSVIVLKSSNKKKLIDIKNLSLGYYDDGSKENEKALDKVRNKQETEVVPYEDTYQLATDLMQGKVDAALLENSYLDILNDSVDSGEDEFKDLIRKIYEFVIITKTSDISIDTDITKKPFNVYISGIDTYGEISSVSRSDVNMIVSVNPSTRQVLLTSIPRDYYVSLHGKTGYKDKLTHAGLYGVDMSVQTLEDLLDIKINYYVKVNFSSVVKIVDAIGGVNVNSDYDFVSFDGRHYKKGINSLNGEEALSFARERKSFAGGDRQRVKNQQALFSAILDKVVSKGIVTKYSKLLDSLHGSFVTNFKMSRLASLARMQIVKKYSWNVASNSLEGEDGSNYTYSAPSFKAYVMVPVPDSVDNAHNLIEDVFDGKVLDKSVTISSRKSTSKFSERDVKDNSQKSVDSNKKDEVSDKVEEAGLEVHLLKDKVTFVEGDSYVYNGYEALCKGKKISTSDGLKEEFKVNGESFNNYQELVSYVSGLSFGDYTINFVLEYKGETVTLKQYVSIAKKQDDKEENKEDEQSDDDNNQELDVNDDNNEEKDSEDSNSVVDDE